MTELILYALLNQVNSIKFEIHGPQVFSGYEEVCINVRRENSFNCFVRRWEWIDGEAKYFNEFNYSATTEEVIELMEFTYDQPEGIFWDITLDTEGVTTNRPVPCSGVCFGPVR